MSVKLPQTINNQSQWADIDLGAEQTLKLQLSRPSFAQQAAVLASQTQAEFIEARITSSVIGWEGVIDDAGQPVPYSQAALLSLFAAYPQALARVNAAVIEVWITHPGDLEKNLPTPPASGGTGTTGETTSSTGSSPSTPSSTGEPLPEPTSATS